MSKPLGLPKGSSLSLASAYLSPGMPSLMGEGWVWKESCWTRLVCLKGFSWVFFLFWGACLEGFLSFLGVEFKISWYLMDNFNGRFLGERVYTRCVDLWDCWHYEDFHDYCPVFIIICRFRWGFRVVILTTCLKSLVIFNVTSSKTKKVHLCLPKLPLNF